MLNEAPTAFIALPDTDGSSDLRAEIENALSDKGIQPTSGKRAAAGLVQQRVQESLRAADFVIADVTGASPNVMMELGMALGMGKRLLLLSGSKSVSLPADLASHQVAVYRPEDLGSVRQYLDLWLKDVVS